MTSMTDLFVIEAPGKLRAFHDALRKLGRNGEVVATLGHVFDNPRSLRPLAIKVLSDGGVVETHRSPSKPVPYRRLLAAIRNATRIYLATDADSEGGVIAQDVWTLARRENPGAAVLRMHFSAMDADSIGRALASAKEPHVDEAVPGSARRIADRIIAAAFSDFERGIYVGRVQTALLGLVAAGAVRRRTAIVPLRAADGGADFVLRCEVPGNVRDDEVHGLSEMVGPVEAGDLRRVAVAPPLDGADALLALEAEVGLEIDAAADLLQRLYEAAKISYPRTMGQGFSAEGSSCIASIAGARAVTAFQRASLPRVAEDAAHEALRPLSPHVDLSTPLGLRKSTSDAAMGLIGRRCVATGLLQTVQDGWSDRLPSWASEGTLSRVVVSCGVPWVVNRPGFAVRNRSPQAALVAAMKASGIGRPSTYARHAMVLVSRGLVTPDLGLTDKGAAALQAAPSQLRSSSAAADFESALQSGGQLPHVLRDAMGALGCEHLLGDVVVKAKRVPIAAWGALMGRGTDAKSGAVPKAPIGEEAAPFEEAGRASNEVVDADYQLDEDDAPSYQFRP